MPADCGNLIRGQPNSLPHPLEHVYDLAGRRTSLTGTLAAFAPPTESPSIAYDGTNRLTSRLGLTTTYDANGNLTALGSTTYTWNARNQLTATSAGSSTFAYDALGRRVSAVVAGTTTGYQYDGLNPVMLGGNFMLAGLGLDENYARVTSGTATSLLTDGLGSTIAMSSSAAATTANYVYSPYGDTVKTGTDATPLEYTGRENDGPTGLYYYRARYYSPQLGRFISEDPIGLRGSGTNFYAYARGAPTRLRDPTGMVSAGDEARAMGLIPIGPTSECSGPLMSINALAFSKFVSDYGVLVDIFDEFFHSGVTANAGRVVPYAALPADIVDIAHPEEPGDRAKGVVSTVADLSIMLGAEAAPIDVLAVGLKAYIGGVAWSATQVATAEQSIIDGIALSAEEGRPYTLHIGH